jgi:hypothetical protein
MKDFKLSRLLISIHLVIFLIICFVLHFLISLPFFFLPDELFGEQDFNMVIEKTGKGMLFFGMVVIAPILETFIFQFLVIKGVSVTHKKTNPGFLCIRAIICFVFFLAAFIYICLSNSNFFYRFIVCNSLLF